MIGGSGSGKDTQAGFLAQKYNLASLSMGNIIREEYRKGNPIAIEAQTVARAGNWSPDHLTSKLLLDHLVENNYHDFVINGYPRFLEQAHTFDKLLAELKLELTCVLHLTASDDVLLGRLRKQAVEAAKGQDKREDTTEEAMRKRLESYHNTINPVLELYKERGVLIEIDATPSIEEVKTAMFAKLDAYTRSKV